MSEKENIEIRDIAHEFNVIVDSVKDSKSDFIHDRYFRFAFAEPSRMAELLTLFSRHNPSLKAFLDTLAQGRFVDYPEYYRDIGFPFKVEFLDVGHAIDDAELRDFSPTTLVALTAMKYIFDVEKEVALQERGN